ncbi:MAG: murein biosynthesis integral membrane protein MurJ [Alphaproteobacteria bacterium]|jgi:putative peptidoglycan lipid II flippase|nr:murein biosynthesis integral membrane protein MurJ [Alphaproteobacteria bacterium]
MSLVRNTLVQSSLTLVSRILGFARDVVLAARIGAGPVGDAFFAALMFPNLFRRFFAEGAFAQAFVPAYARTLEADGPQAARQVAEEAMRVLFAVTAAIVIAAQLAMPWIMVVFMGSYLDDTDIFGLAVLLTQITMPYLACMALAALLAGLLNSAGRFALTAGAPTVLNICIIAAALLGGDKAVTARFAAIAVTLAGLLQVALLWHGVRRQGLRLSLIGLPRLTTNVKRVMALAVPGAIAASGMQINILVSQALAGLEQGARSWLQFADRLYQLPLGLVGVAVGVAILPRLSRAARAGDSAAGGQMMDDAVGLAMALTLPAAAALLVAPAYLIEGLFARGAFTSEDARLAGLALLHFAWGVPAFVLIKVLAPGFFAREDTKTPMRFALVSVVINTLLGAGLFFWLRQQGEPGFPGLALATSAAAWVNAGALFLTLRARGWYRPGPLLARRLASAIMASLGMAFTLVILLTRARGWLDGLAPSRFLEALAFIAIGMGVYGLFALWFGAVRPGDIKALARRPAAE